MLYFLETKLPENKSVLFALTSIYGIGQNTAFMLCKKLGFSVNLKVKNLTKDQVDEMLQTIDSLDLILNNELKKLKSVSLKNLVDIKSLKGLRRVRGLPVRGQRTHTNANSSKKNKRL